MDEIEDLHPQKRFVYHIVPYIRRCLTVSTHICINIYLTVHTDQSFFYLNVRHTSLCTSSFREMVDYSKTCQIIQKNSHLGSKMGHYQQYVHSFNTKTTWDRKTCEAFYLVNKSSQLLVTYWLLFGYFTSLAAKFYISIFVTYTHIGSFLLEKMLLTKKLYLRHILIIKSFS